MPDIPEEAVKAAREEVRRRYGAAYLEIAECAAKAAAPALTAQVRHEYEDLLGSVWLYIGWRYVTKQLTTEEKEMFADAVEASERRLNKGFDPPLVVDRWWRDDARARQIGGASDFR
ncbi:hypothetical protein [Nonomuraea typhae]|uniref:Uncharacterized protein n=1 Tax=Nonomuraea typhae TaxID=2603600 RepID=A0ABW7YLV2_9ACTN